jgi:hypothetical protein
MGVVAARSVELAEPVTDRPDALPGRAPPAARNREAGPAVEVDAGLLFGRLAAPGVAALAAAAHAEGARRFVGVAAAARLISRRG